ncbi:MAG: PKD domain-containing protein [Proteobacteria bacterium]|nr:PKD domain-containing protein [Pseudomonadota bacterium]
MTSSYKVIRGLRRAAAIAALPLALAACGGGGGGGSSGPAEPPPAAVTPLPSLLNVSVPATAEPGAAVTLKTAFTGANDLRYAWIFGDGGSSSEMAAVHAFSAPGRYVWSLTVSNGLGQSASASGTLYVGWFERLAGAQCSGANQTGWCWQGAGSEPFATDVHCADAQHCVAVGALGQAASTSDGGRTWALSRVPLGGETLTRVRMADANTVYAFGTIGRTVWRSRDGGKTWALAAQPVTPLLQSPFGDQGRVWTLDAQIVVASANSGWIGRDSGSTWTALPMQVGSVTANGFLWSNGDTAVSPDQGQTLRPVPAGSLADGRYRSVLARLGSDALHLRLLVRETVPANPSAATRLLLLSSADGGQSFTESQAVLPGDVDPAWVSAAVLRDDGRADALVAGVTAAGTQYGWLHSSDEGRHWSAQALTADTGRSLTGVGLSSDGGVLILRNANLALDAGGGRGRYELLDLQTGQRSPVGSDGADLNQGSLDRLAGGLLSKRQGIRIVEVSSDGGSTWAALPKAGVQAGVALGQTLFFDARQGFSVRNGVVSRTTDGGWSWQPVSGVAPGLPGDRWQMLADGSVLLLGNPDVHRSTDRGQTWSLVPTPAPRSPGEAFFDGSHGWAATCTMVSPGSTNCVVGLQRTTDGGQSWQAAAVPAGVSLIQRLVFTSATEGVLQGNDGSVWWTADGGLSWTLAATLDAAGANSPTLAKGRLTSDRNGTLWMLGGTADNDVLLRSTDHGRNWRVMALPVAPSADGQARLKDVATLDGRRIWVVGRGGLVLASDDGGAQWRAQASGTLLDLDAVSAFDAQTAWITAASGELVFTTSTGGD